MTAEHKPVYGRAPRGRQAWGNLRGAAGIQYGTTVRCTCGGFKKQINIAPSRGGQKEAEAFFAEHVKETS